MASGTITGQICDLLCTISATSATSYSIPNLNKYRFVLFTLSNIGDTAIPQTLLVPKEVFKTYNSSLRYIYLYYNTGAGAKNAQIYYQNDSSLIGYVNEAQLKARVYGVS